MKKRHLYGILAGLGICIAGALYYYGRPDVETVVKAPTYEAAEQSGEETLQETSSTAEAAAVYVHICGCVERPGVYSLPEGSRVSDAVDAAGGFSAEADRDYLNLALVLADGMQIRIPSLAEAESMKSAEEAASDGLVNINTAGVDELMSLPGIGEVKAEAIVEYRSRNGPFEDISDIMRVAGIKESAFEQIRHRIKVG